MITIRPYDKKDYRYVQQLGGGDESYVRQICRCALYCNYYVDCEPQFCFVAVDENDLSAVTMAQRLGADPACVFKTLVARGDRTGILMACIRAGFFRTSASGRAR